LKDPPVRDPDGQRNPGEKDAMKQQDQREQTGSAATVENGQALTLEAEMRNFIGEDLLADRSQDGRTSRTPDCLIVDHGVAFHHDDGGCPHLHGRPAITKCAETGITPVALGARHAGEVQATPQGGTMPLLFSDKKTHSIHKPGIVDAPGVIARRCEEVRAVGSLAELPRPEGRADGLDVLSHAIGTDLPGDRPKARSVEGEPGDPLLGGANWRSLCTTK
jgi:hypothetical protein